MRTFEALILIASLIWVFTIFSLPHKKKTFLYIFFAVSSLIALIHIFAEGLRFHMFPAYIVFAGLLLMGIAGIFSDKKKRSISKAGFFIGATTCLLFIAFSFILSTKFPVFKFPAPTGKYQVGKTVKYFTDTGRDDFLSAGKLKREIKADIWYPAFVDSSKAVYSMYPYMQKFVWSKLTFIPEILFSHVCLIKTHSVYDAAIAPAQSPFPVVIFSHGYEESSSSSYFLTEELASRGYIVISINHTYGAEYSDFPDGRILRNTSTVNPVLVSDSSKMLLNQWFGDVKFILDKIPEINGNTGEMFFGKLDLLKIGYAGHNFGGAAVSEALRNEPRITAGVNIDGKPYFSEETSAKCNKPVMIINSQFLYPDFGDATLEKLGYSRDEYLRLKTDHTLKIKSFFDRITNTGYNININGVNTLSFTDLPLFSTLVSGKKDLIDPDKAHGIVNKYIIAFFDKHLLNINSPLLEPGSRPPDNEVKVEFK